MTKANRFKAIQTLHDKAEKALRSAVNKAILQHEFAGVPAVVWHGGKVVQITGKSVRVHTRHK